MEAELAVELGRDSGPLRGGECLSHMCSMAVTLGRVSRQETEQQTQPSCGGCLGVMAQREL